ncbi:glycosyltransferase [Microbacterium trichothecenolyticum]|uniref:glycosyltransferase n=1 Tax=Microbacterium trichothecenolyticum TaxID=69370 RepID=UPI0035BE5A04
MEEFNSMPSHRPDLVSIVIVDDGSPEDTISSVAALERVDWPRDLLEVVVVAPHTPEGREDPFRSVQAPARVVRTRAEATVTAGLNLGAANVRGQYVGFLESGARPEPDWIRQAVRTFHAGAQIGAVASKVVSHDGATASFAGGSLTWFGRGYSLTGNGAPSAPERPRDLLFGSRSALFVRTKLFADLGGFDERLAAQFDDVDLGWRLNLFGHRLRYTPTSAVRAPENGEGSPGDGDGPQAHYLRERNSLILLYKNVDDANLGRFLAGALGLAARRAVTASNLDSRSFDRPESDREDVSPVGEVTVGSETLAGLYGIDQFVDILGELAPERTRIQNRRVVRDDAVFPLFGNSTDALQPDGPVRQSLDEIAGALGITTPGGRIRVLVITGDLLGPRMAGPAIRAWNMCEQLAVRNDVRLVSPIKPTRASTSFQVFHTPDDRAMREHEEWADVIVMQGYILHQFRSLARTEKILVADIYDPLHLEQLEQARTARFDDWNTHVILASEVLNEQIAKADFLLCASEKQRDFWLGQLAAVGRVNAMTYEADNALRDLLDVAPFGLDPDMPPQGRHAIKGTVPGIGPDDKVLLWGGGIYDWFDTATLLRAMAKVVQTHPDARLFFLGVAHPNPGVPVMKAQAKTFELSAELGLTDKYVFFNREWVAFDDRHNYLLDADAGVSTHFEHIETSFSFRTRILDYLWARLPMVTTRGDGFADLIDSSPLGVTVPEQDVDALAEGIIRVLYDQDLRATVASAIESVREEFSWSHALEPLTSFCAAPRTAPDRQRGSHAHVLRMPDPTADAIRARYRGLGKSARLASHYLVREGPRGLVRRVRFRLGF